MIPVFSSSVPLLLLILNLPSLALGGQILRTSGFTTCLPESNMTVQSLDIEYNADAKEVTFNVAGTSTSEQNVTAQLNVVAYGVSVYQKSFDPCSPSSYVSQLCPVPIGKFAATGTQIIPEEYASQIPSIAFTVPDISATATLQLNSLNTNMDVACIRANVNNGKSAQSLAVSYVAVGIAGAALIMTGVSTAGAAAGAAGAGIPNGGASNSVGGTTTPSFVEVFGWFQGLAMNGMLSVNYPPVYRSFTKNFAFSTGLVPWTAMQTSIDNFRQRTGGNLTENSVRYLKERHSLVVDGGPIEASQHFFNTHLITRDSISTSVNNTVTSPATSTSQSSSQVETTLNGIKAYVEELSVPEANTFLTVLLVVACVIAAIVVGILLCKVILEVWVLFGSLPKSLVGFRKHYWSTMARSIVQLILVLYGVWVLYCIFQFTHGDSWAVKTLAAVSLTIVTSILLYFGLKIWQTAKKLERLEGDASGLYQDKENWLKYSMFYDSYSKDFWWMFLPVILYMFSKGCILAAGNGHGLGQTIAQLIVEISMLILLIWNRPYVRRSGNVINIFIQVVRGLSLACILLFVEELGISQTTQTVTGVVLIAVQSILTGVLAVLIASNAIIAFCKQNPHRKRRKEAKRHGDDSNSVSQSNSRDTRLKDPSFIAPNSSFNFDEKFPFPETKPINNESYSSRDSAQILAGSLPEQQHSSRFSRPEKSHFRGYRSDSQDGLLNDIQREPYPHTAGVYRGIAW